MGRWSVGWVIVPHILTLCAFSSYLPCTSLSCRRYKGTYGPAISAANGSFPGPGTTLPGLYRCGDSCQPGIGVPAAAASGMIAANTLAPVLSHLQLLDALGL